MFRNFNQLLPVLDLPIYASSQEDSLFNDKYMVYQQFWKIYILNAIEYQSENSKTQQSFRDIFSWLHNEKSILTNWKKFTSRLEDKLPKTECDRFSDATFILLKWSNIDFVNINKLKSLNCPIVKIKAIHTEGRKTKRVESDTAKGL